MFPPVSLDELVHIAAIRRQAVSRLLALRNVIACGIGFKVRDQQIVGIPSIVISVVHKEPRSTLPDSEVIPRFLQGVPTDVVETGLITELDIDRRAPIRPVQPGVSIGHRDGTAGTLGCIVRRGEQAFLLGNNHVLSLLNAGRPGDPILQPGPGDGGTLESAIGELAAYVPINFQEPASATLSGAAAPRSRQSGSLLLLLRGLFERPQQSAPAPAAAPPENRMDAALVRPYGHIALDPGLVGLGGAPTGVADAALGMKVFKSGRSSGVTEGYITQVDVTVNVQYGPRTARFVNQIILTPLSQKGDSGALLVTKQRQAVGLLFSGSETVSVASPIRLVLAAFRAKLATP